ncbi:MAG TPA: VWA domain-containing protein [Thermoanaerobaculia bacterium]|jgi:VWFA-related protein|nr:VWA domain-containing protein [Thermoanaerobaculia bacterium]
MKKHSAPLIAAIVLLLAAGAGAQTRESITVQVVEVPVYVFGHGKPIRNLTKDNFELFVNGKRQTIDYFDPIEFAPAAAAPPTQAEKSIVAPPPADPRERRLFLLLFDLTHRFSRPAVLAIARKSALTMVDRALPQDFFGVATYSLLGVKFVIPFTRDHDVIRRAVLKLSPSNAHDALAISITDAERQSAEAWSSASASGAGRAGNEDPMPEILAGFGVEEQQRAKTEAKEQMDDYAKLAKRMASLEGYKHVILFSEGINPSVVTGATPELGLPQVPGLDPRQYAALDSMARSFQAAGVLFHTVDLGVVDPISVNMSAAPLYINDTSPMTNNTIRPASVQRFNVLSNETLYTWAARTGGQFLHWTNDIPALLADLSSSVTAGYRLGFKPVDPRNGMNDIDIKVNNVPRGTTVSFRKGFSSTSEPPNTDDALLLADIIQNDIPQSGTPPAFSFRTRPYIEVVVPARQLAKELGVIKRAGVFLYIFDDKGVAVAQWGKDVPILAQPRGDAVIRQKLTMPPGNYVAKALLRVGKSIGFAKIAFTIPDAK